MSDDGPGTFPTGPDPIGPDPARLRRRISATWRESIIPALQQYISIPAVSSAFDGDWEAHGHIDAATELVAAWCRSRPIAGLQVSVVRLPGRTPMVVCEIAASEPADHPGSVGHSQTGGVLLYGHLDKQPEMEGWRADLGPWNPVIDGERLYGRGGADDGYSAFASLLAIEALQAEGGRHGRCVLLVEASEESGSPDLAAYVEHLAERIGTPELVICLDSGCATYNQLWVTTSLRGMCRIDLTVEVLREGVHSGGAGGVVPSSWRIVRQLLSRIEDERTGELIVAELTTPVPAQRQAEAELTAAVLGPTWAQDIFPFAGGTQPLTATTAEALLARTWHASLEVIGVAGLPPPDRAGNVLRPSTQVVLAVRLPPTLDVDRAFGALKRILTADPPHGAIVHLTGVAHAGWEAPPTSPWLQAAIDDAAAGAFGRPPGAIGEGGGIPFMGLLAHRFPHAQFVITGVLGPASNAHGPNEFLHVPTAVGLTVALALLIAHHHAAPILTSRPLQ